MPEASNHSGIGRLLLVWLVGLTPVAPAFVSQAAVQEQAIVDGTTVSRSARWLPPVKVKPSFGVYRDNSGHSRLKSDLDLSSGSVGLNLGQEVVRDDGWQQDKYLSSLYGSGERRNLSGQLSLSGNPGGPSGKLTDLRAVVSGSSDSVVSTKTVGAGFSRWFVHETMQVGLDLSSTAVNQPEFEILDFDATALTAPETVDSSSATVSFRHLTSPTTMTLASVSSTERSDRPNTRFYHVGIRQYVPPAMGAVHLSVYRGLNHGTLSTKTLYGEVDSWTGEIAWLQELGEKSQLRFGWRVHQELEIGRAFGDKTQFGSDLYSVGLASDLDPALTFGRNVTLDIGLARYETNQDLVAGSANLGVTGYF